MKGKRTACTGRGISKGSPPLSGVIQYKKQINEEVLNDAVTEILMKLVSNPEFAALMQEKINMKVDMYQRSELDYLIYNDPLAYADLILNGDPETYLKTVTEYKPLD